MSCRPAPPGGEAELCQSAANFLLPSTQSHAPIVGGGPDGAVGPGAGRWRTRRTIASSMGSDPSTWPICSSTPSRTRPSAHSARRRRRRVAAGDVRPEPTPAARAGGERGRARGSRRSSAALHPREAFARSRSVAETARPRRAGPGPLHSSLNVPIGSTRRFRIIRSPLAELKAIRGSFEQVGERRRPGRLHDRTAPAARRAR